MKSDGTFTQSRIGDSWTVQRTDLRRDNVNEEEVKTTQKQMA